MLKLLDEVGHKKGLGSAKDALARSPLCTALGMTEAAYVEAKRRGNLWDG